VAYLHPFAAALRDCGPRKPLWACAHRKLAGTRPDGTIWSSTLALWCCLVPCASASSPAQARGQVCQTCAPPSLALSPCMQSSVPTPLSCAASATQLSLHFALKHPANAPVKAGACHHGPLFWSCPPPQASRCALYAPSRGLHLPHLAATFSPCRRLPLHAPCCSQAQPPSGFGRRVPRPWAVNLSASAHPQEVGRCKARRCHLELDLGSVVPPRPSSLRFLSRLWTPPSVPNLPAPGPHCQRTPAGSQQAQGQAAPFGAQSWLCGAALSLVPPFPPPLMHAASTLNLRAPLPCPRSPRAKFCACARTLPRFCGAAQLALRPRAPCQTLQ